MNYDQHSRLGNFSSKQGLEGRARYKRVHKADMVAHLWANEAQPEARNATGNLYFRGTTIYSYSDSWPVASFIRPGVVALNTERRSVTTSGHASIVRRAIKGLTVDAIDVESQDVVCQLVHGNNEEAERLFVLYFIKAGDRAPAKLQIAARDLGNPRRTGADSADMRLNSFDTCVREYESTWRALFGRDFPHHVHAMVATMREAIVAGLGDFYNPGKVAKRKKAAAARERRACVERAKRAINKYTNETMPSWNRRASVHQLNDALATLIQEKGNEIAAPLLRQVQEFQAAIESRQLFDAHHPDARTIMWKRRFGSQDRITAEKWIAGARGEFYQDTPTLCRRLGDTLETSRGAEVPWRAAQLAYLKAQTCRANGEAWKSNEETIPVGTFHVDSISPMGNIKAGCHVLDFAEMTRVAIKECPEIVRPCFPLPAVIPVPLA